MVQPFDSRSPIAQQEGGASIGCDVVAHSRTKTFDYFGTKPGRTATYTLQAFDVVVFYTSCILLRISFAASVDRLEAKDGSVAQSHPVRPTIITHKGSSLCYISHTCLCCCTPRECGVHQPCGKRNPPATPNPQRKLPYIYSGHYFKIRTARVDMECLG